MKIQLYPITNNNSKNNTELQIDPLTQQIDLFFKKPIDNQKTTCYNRDNKTKGVINHVRFN